MLIGDDEKHTMASIADTLLNIGFEIEIVSDPSMALDALKDLQFDVQAVDFLMVIGHKHWELCSFGVPLIERIHSGFHRSVVENMKIAILVLATACHFETLKSHNLRLSRLCSGAIALI